MCPAREQPREPVVDPENRELDGMVRRFSNQYPLAYGFSVVEVVIVVALVLLAVTPELGGTTGTVLWLLGITLVVVALCLAAVGFGMGGLYLMFAISARRQNGVRNPAPTADD
jgi:hypothetical protein